MQTDEMTLDKLGAIMLKGFERVDQRFDGLESRMDKIESRVDSIEIKLTNIFSEIENIKDRLSSIEEFIVSSNAKTNSNKEDIDSLYKEFIDLKGKLAVLEKKIGNSKITLTNVVE